jgi:hypothetical protein
MRRPTFDFADGLRTGPGLNGGLQRAKRMAHFVFSVKQLALTTLPIGRLQTNSDSGGTTFTI